MNNCIVCDKNMYKGYQSWHIKCLNCGYEKANFQLTINDASSHELIDEMHREVALNTVRINNFNKIYKVILSLKPSGGSLLDVGCAHGWFLNLFKNDFNVLGIEPDLNIAQVRRDLPIRAGYYPSAINANERFDIITFNDVIEHIQALKNTLKSCYTHLNSKGLLVLNLPNSNGVFYKISKVLCGLGFPSFFERMWQKDFPSPHLHYLKPYHITTLLEEMGFDVRYKSYLSTISWKGLYSRISYGSKYPRIMNVFIYVCISLFLPWLSVLPKDIMVVIASKK